MAEWITVLTAAAAVAASIKTVAEATKTLGGFAGDIWHWFESHLGHAGDRQARKVWENFKENPERNKDALIAVSKDLKPNGDPLLESYVLGVAKQKSREKAVQVYALLSSELYTFDQVKDIGIKVGVTRAMLGTGYTMTDAAARIVEYAGTQETRWNKLIEYMIDVNPEVIGDIIRLVYD